MDICIKDVLFKNYPNRFKDEFVDRVNHENYRRSSFFSYILVPIAMIFYIIAIIENECTFILHANLLFFILSLVNCLLFRIKMQTKERIDKYNRVIIYILLLSVLGWSSVLVAFIPNRYELFGTFSIVILSVSSILLLKWQVNIVIYILSLFFILTVSQSFMTHPIIPKITVMVSLVIISFVISRLLYFKEMQSFVSKLELEKQNQNIKEEVLKQSNKLKNYEDIKIEEISYSMTKLLDIHDSYTNGHSEKVALLSQRIAKRMCLSNENIKDAYWSGMVHDIGKLLIPIDILNKKKELTDEEYVLIKKHPVWGYDALSNSETLKNIAKYVLYHHERWDGQGYPRGLKDNEIPLISQILSVADTWDAMTSERAYRQPLPEDKAIKEIINNKGTQFSPKVVEIFLAMHLNEEII